MAALPNPQPVANLLAKATANLIAPVQQAAYAAVVRPLSGIPLYVLLELTVSNIPRTLGGSPACSEVHGKQLQQPAYVVSLAVV